MKVGILTWNEKSWCSSQLRTALLGHNVSPICFSFQSLVARVGLKPEVLKSKIDILRQVEAIIIRPIGRGSLEEIIFRMDLLRRLERLGKYILNSPVAIERSVDKYLTLALLDEAGLPVPKTIVTENANTALESFIELGGDVVIKPIFGSRGIGSTRVSDVNIAERIFRALAFNHQVAYLQTFIPHENRDLRLLVLGSRVLASMQRIADTWKTNVSLGAQPIPCQPPSRIKELAIHAAQIIGCKVAGVDILETKKGPFVIELNSQPGWRGLQSVTDLNIADEIVSYVLKEVKR